MHKRTSSRSIDLTFDNARLLRDLFGVHDSHLKVIEDQLDVSVSARGNLVRLSGPARAVEKGEQILVKMYGLLKSRPELDHKDVEDAVRLLASNPSADVKDVFSNGIPLVTKRRMILPRSVGQKVYVEAIRKNDLVFGVGPAGTGKTYLAMAMAIGSLIRHEFERIVLTRPAVEAGEKLGFLPGSIVQKVDPYLRPLYDALHDMIDLDQAKRWVEDGVIEVAPLAFMRGRTLNNSFVILDEAQNCTPEQMKMFLTRLGRDAKAVVTGDITQIDLPADKRSGMVEAIGLLEGLDGIAVISLSQIDVVRHPLVKSIITAYEKNGGPNRGK